PGGVADEQPAIAGEPVHGVAVVPLAREIMEPAGARHAPGEHRVKRGVAGEKVLDRLAPFHERGPVGDDPNRGHGGADGNLPGPAARHRQQMDMDEVGGLRLAAVHALEPAVDRELVEERVLFLQFELAAENRISAGGVHDQPAAQEAVLALMDYAHASRGTVRAKLHALGVGPLEHARAPGRSMLEEQLIEPGPVDVVGIVLADAQLRDLAEADGALPALVPVHPVGAVLANESLPLHDRQEAYLL